MLEAQAKPKREIPAGLSIIAYLYFAAGVWLVAENAFLFYLVIHSNSGGFDPTQPVNIWLACTTALGLLFIGLSLGLRRGSRGWRNCALILIWIGFADVGLHAYWLFAPYFHIHTHRPIIELSTRAILILVGCLLLGMWQYRVLTRLDVRDLFYGKP